MAKDKEKSKDDKDEEERMKRIMMAATGYATIEEARNKRSAGVGRDGRAVTSAKEFLEDMEDDVKHDLASASLEIIAPDEKEDMKLNSVLIGGPAPKPPERRNVLHTQLAQTLNSSRGKSAGTDQSMNLMDPTLARRGASNAKGRTGFSANIFGGSRNDTKHLYNADSSMDSEEYIIQQRHMVRYYNFICFLVVCILTMMGSTLLVMTFTANNAPEPIEQTTQDGAKGTSSFGIPTPAPIAKQVSKPPTKSPISAPVSAPTPDESASIDRFEEILSKLVNSGFAEESRLRNGITAQFKALDWLASHDAAGLDPSSEDILPRYALAVLYYSTSGREPKMTSTIRTSWEKHELWLSGANYCEWYGIKCVGEDDYFVKEGNGTIFQLDLAENKLKGKIPSELAVLSDLKSLDLRSNSLSGTIPREFKFPAMKSMYLDFNYLNGTIDTLQLQDMKELRTLSIPYNEFTGTIPASIGYATNLRYLKLGGNKLIGNFPSTMANLIKLETLHASKNQLNGTIPDHFFEMTRLVNLTLSKNQFEGTLSTKLNQLSHLQELHLTGNAFSGTVPDAFGNMLLLATLHLGENRLSGEVPKSLGSRHRLEKLDLTSNGFVGTMPQEICELKETGKLYHLGADCIIGGDSTVLDVSSMQDNRRHRRLAVISRPPKDDDTSEADLDEGDLVFDGTIEDQDGSVIDGETVENPEDLDHGKAKVRATTSRLGGSFVMEDEPDDEEVDAEIIVGDEVPEEEVINQGDYVYLEEDGTVEDQDGNVIDGLDIEDVENLDEAPEEEEVINAGDFVYLEEDGTVEDQDGNVIEGVAMEDLEDQDGNIVDAVALENPEVVDEDEPELYLEEDGTIEDKDGNIIEGVALEDLEAVDEDIEDQEPELYLEEDGTIEDKDGNIIEGVALEDLEAVDEEPELYLEEDGTIEDQDGNIVEGIALEDLEVAEEPEGGIANARSAPQALAVPLGPPNEDEDEEVIEFHQPSDAVGQGRSNGAGQIAYAGVSAVVDSPGAFEGLSGIDCPCCTFCLAPASSGGAFQNGRSASISVEGPVGSSDCVLAITEGNPTDGYPGLVGMSAREAKKCLESNTNKSVILVSASIRRHFSYENNRIIIFFDRDNNVKKAPKVG